MTKRIVSGIFILTALGALGVILAGALTSGEQLIVRFLTAVIVAALGLYVISDLRLQADDDAMTARSGGPTRLTSVDAPPNSTAAFMATVTKKVDPSVVEPVAQAAGDNTEMLQTTVLADGDPMLARASLPPAPQPHQQVSGMNDGHGLRARRTVSSHPKPAPDTVFAAGPLSAGADAEGTEAPAEHNKLEALAKDSKVSGLFAPVVSADCVEDDQVEAVDESGLESDDAVTSTATATSTDIAASADVVTSDETIASAEVAKVAASDDAKSLDETSMDEDMSSLDDELAELDSEIAAGLDDELDAIGDVEEPAELVGSMAGVSGGIIDATGTFKTNGTGERNGLNGHSGPFDLASTTAKISFSNDPLGDNVSFGNGILTGTQRGDSGSNGHSVNGGSEKNGTDQDGADKNGHHNNGTEKNGHGTPIEAELVGLEDDAQSAGPEKNGAEKNGAEKNGHEANGAEFTTYSDDLQSPETVWPAPPTSFVDETELNGASTYIRFDNPSTPDHGGELNGHAWLPAPTGDAELQAAEYADAPLAPIIDLRDLGLQATDSVDHAINAGEVEVIATLIEQGMLSTDGPISDRDVRTMVYVAFTSNELRKLLLAGGTPDGPNYGLDLGPVELFDERIHAPAPKTLYSGIDRPEAQSQLG